MRKRSLEKQFLAKLNSITRYGESKFEAKKIEGQNPKGIFSYSTFNKYRATTKQFCNYLKDKNIKCNNLTEAKEYVNEFLQSKIDRDLSSWTIKTDKAVFNKIYNQDLFLCLKNEKKRSSGDIKRSRDILKGSKNFNTNLVHNNDFKIFCESTGLRRSEINNFSNLKLKDIVKIDDSYYINNVCGKGNKKRNIPVLKVGNDVLEKYINRAKQNGCDRLFGISKANTKAPIHYYRANYAKALYQKLENNNILDNLKFYSKFQYSNSKLADYTKGNGKYKSILNGKAYNRLAICITSQALGHNREDVVVQNYLF